MKAELEKLIEGWKKEVERISKSKRLIDYAQKTRLEMCITEAEELLKQQDIPVQYAEGEDDIAFDFHKANEKFECYEIWRPNIPANGCAEQCKECAEKEQLLKNQQKQ